MTITDPLYDESDLQVEGFYCRHGRFIGNPYGADYLCGHCEMGTSDEEYELGLAWGEFRSRMRNEVLPTWFAALPADVPTTLTVYGVACVAPLLRRT